MLRSWATLSHCYCELLRFWRACPDKACRRARRCRDRSGNCWQARYPRTGPVRERLRAQVKAHRGKMPIAVRHLPGLHDPADGLL